MAKNGETVIGPDLALYMDTLRSAEYCLRILSKDRINVPEEARAIAAAAAMEARAAMEMPALAKAEWALRMIASNLSVDAQSRAKALKVAGKALDVLVAAGWIGPPSIWQPKKFRPSKSEQADAYPPHPPPRKRNRKPRNKRD